MKKQNEFQNNFSAIVRKEMKSKGIKVKTFCESNGFGETSFFNKLAGRCRFSIYEIIKICDDLDLGSINNMVRRKKDVK